MFVPPYRGEGSREILPLRNAISPVQRNEFESFLKEQNMEAFANPIGHFHPAGEKRIKVS